MESTMLHCHVNSSPEQTNQTLFLYFFAFFLHRARPEVFSWLPSATTLLDTFKPSTLDLQGKIIKNALICMHSNTQMLQRTVSHRRVGRDVCLLHKQWSPQTSMFCMTNRHSYWQTKQIQDSDDWWLGFHFFIQRKNVACHHPLRDSTDQFESLTVLIEGVCVTCC